MPTVPSSALPLTQRIDHTLLHPVVQPDEIARLCHEVTQWHFATVCVNSRFVSLAAVLLEKTGVVVCASVAFPFGAMSTEAKICEAQSAAWDGATEVDMVLPIGLLKAQRYREVFADILYVRQAVEQPARLRVALETGLLTTDNCYLGRVPLINSGGASGKDDLAKAVRTAVINKPAGATGFISGRKAFTGG